MTHFLNIFLAILIFNETIFSFFYEINFNFSNYYIFIYLILIYANFLTNNEVRTKLDLDLTFKYLILMLKTPNFLLNFFINTIKKVYLFLIKIKYRHVYYTCSIIFKKYFKSFFLLWRPLFKKTSYFGYYRSNRSKWIK